MNSIRRRTLTLIIGLLFAGLLILTTFNLHDSNHEIDEIYDAQLAQHARLLLGIMRIPSSSADQAQLYHAFNLALSQAMPRVDGHPYESKIAFQVRNRKGNPLVRTISAPALAQQPLAPGFGNEQDDDGHQWRTFILDDRDSGLRVWVGERVDVRSDLVDRIMRHTLWPNVAGSLLLVLMTWLAIGWGLRPLANMAALLRARPSGSLEPLHLEPLPRELEPMQAALNRMLTQIQELLGRERRFIADAAHELRTPLAVLRVHAQNLLQAGSEEERRASLESLILGVDRAGRLVNQLLTMARLEPMAQAASERSIDLAHTVRESLVQLTPWLLSKGLELSFEVDERSYPLCAEATSIDIALNNLISNAVNFSPANGTINVRLAQVGERFELSVEDQGPGIDESQRERLFEPFYSRGNAQGAGLGLSIVSLIARHLGGRLALDNLPQGGLRATLSIPCGSRLSGAWMPKGQERHG